MGGKGGGGSPAPTQSTVTQTDLPAYAKPYFEKLMQEAQKETARPYDPYAGTRLAGPAAGTLESEQALTQLGRTGVPEFDVAQASAARAADYQAPLASRLGSLAGIAYQTPEQARQAAAQATGFQAQQFGAPEAQQYMDPYLEQVLERQKESIRREAQRQQAGRSAQAVQAGAFGGSRQAVQEALAEENVMRQMADVEATGRQRAFEQAQQQFERDRQARAEAQRLGLAGAQQLAEQDLRARQLGLQSAEQLANLEAQAQQLGMTGAELLASLGAKEFETGVQAAGLLEAVGKAETAREQQMLDMAYQDYLRQRDYPREQLQFMSSILRGVPVSPSQEQAMFQPVNPYQQLLGTGISGLSLYRALGGGS